MLFIDAEELRKKGNIVLLGGGVILDGINSELLKVLDNIDDLATEPEKARKIKIEFSIKPNFNRDKVSLACDISSTLAAKNVLQMRMNLEKSIDDEGKLITMRTDLEDVAEGQQTIDGSEEKTESFDVRVTDNERIIEADFDEKPSNNSIDSNCDSADTNTPAEEKSASNQLESSENNAYDLFNDEDAEFF